MSINSGVIVSIIIVNYNTKHLTINCIKSVVEKTQDVGYEIILVDNASSDNSVAAIKEQFPFVKIIQNENNVGFGRANNIGALNAVGSFLFLLNSDTYLTNNAIKILLENMQKDTENKIGVCGANLFTDQLSPHHSFSQGFPTLLNILAYRRLRLGKIIKCDVFNYSMKSKDVDIVIGADMFIRKGVFELAGGFDPIFFMYMEDTELCLRIKKLGFRIVSFPEAHIIHYQGKSSLKEDKLIMEVSSHIYYFEKHGTGLDVFGYKVIELIFALIKVPLFISNKGRRSVYLKLIAFLFNSK